MKSGPQNPEQSISSPALIAQVLGIGVWFGALAGLLERPLYHWFPATLGPDDLWYAALADLLFFFAAALLALLLWPGRARLKLSAATVFLCSALLVADALSIAFPQPGRGLELSAAAAGAALALTAIFLRWERGALGIIRLTLPLAAAYLLAYLVILPAWMKYAHPEARDAAGPRGSAPNVLVVIADTLRADHLSAYGYSRPTSPELERFAQRAVVFENAVAPASWTLPSHASMLTGRYPTEHQAGEYAWRLDARFPTLAEGFAQRGYRTAAFSGNAFLFNRRAGFGRGYMHFEDGSVLERIFQTNLGRRIENRLMLARLLENVIGRQPAKVINQRALAWMDSGGGPFFVTINYFDLHEPFMPPLKYLHRFSRLQQRFNQFYWLPEVALPPQTLADTVDSYDACVAWADHQFGALLEQLQQRGLLQNTIVVFTSDHGEEFQEHGFMFHNKGLYWELIHVPLMIAGPGAPAGRRIARPVETQDLPTTLLAMAASGGGFPGESLARLWQDPGAETNWPYPVSELGQMGDTPRFPSYFGAMKSVVTPQWHYIEGGASGHELFACCGAELAEASSSPSGKLIAAALGAAMENHRTVTPELFASAIASETGAAAALAAAATPGSASQRERMNSLLRALGYAP